MSDLIVKVCKIDKILEHPNADRLRIAVIGGWNCIIGMSDYNEGDSVVFVPPDSIIPNELIEKHKLEYLRKDGRTKTIKLRGCLSEGLVLPVPDGNYKIGDDVSKVMGITKYEVKDTRGISSGGNKPTKKSINPLLSKYTDINNIKHYNGLFDENDLVVITEKIHGSNARYANLKTNIKRGQPISYIIRSIFEKLFLGETHEFVYGSHNVQLHGGSKNKNFYGEDVWGRIAEKYDLKNKIPKDMIVYGEIYGRGIQDLTYGLDDVNLIVFDIKFNNEYLGWEEVKGFCNGVGLPHVPELYVGRYYDGIVDEYTRGNSVLAPNQIREGIVIKTLTEQKDFRIGRKILKSVSEEYLLRKNGTEFK